MNYYYVNKLVHYCHSTVNKIYPLSDQIIDYCDLTFVLGGSLTYFADGKEVTVKKGDAIFMPTGTLRVRLGEASFAQYVSFNFIPDDPESISLPLYIENCVTPNIQRYIDAIPQNQLHSRHPLVLIGANQLNCILHELLTATPQTQTSSHIDKMMRFINEHVTEKITLKDVSEHARLSKEYTASIFKKETGMTVTEYINEQKLLLAKEIIRRNNMSLADVAASLGFENYSYFSKLFKRRFGECAQELKTKK